MPIMYDAHPCALTFVSAFVFSCAPFVPPLYVTSFCSKRFYNIVTAGRVATSLHTEGLWDCGLPGVPSWSRSWVIWPTEQKATSPVSSVSLCRFSYNIIPEWNENSLKTFPQLVSHIIHKCLWIHSFYDYSAEIRSLWYQFVAYLWLNCFSVLEAKWSV